ncbi:MAG: transporter ATP-binding protein [Frankiales bacterium]|jgi:ABC-2 type transport system ATP-binding protein|nr:transporter ATP-binding protein [Frankiales bacterium]
MTTTLVFDALTKRFGDTAAVEGLTATVHPGRVTGFLGPNGAGKTTTLRMLLGLVRPTSGTATFDGRRYDELSAPVREVGTLLEATGFHPGRSARNHLRILSTAAGLPPGRPDQVLELVGLTPEARRKVGDYSLGMRQRLGLAAALLGDPPVLVLDEPANGLDPQGIRWLRSFLRSLAAEGRTVLVSSHVLPEIEQTADDVLVVAKGRLVRSGTLAELQAEGRGGTTVRTPDGERLAQALADAGLVAHGLGSDELVVQASPAAVGELAARHGIVLHRLAETAGGLEDVFLSLTGQVQA